MTNFHKGQPNLEQYIKDGKSKQDYYKDMPLYLLQKAWSVNKNINIACINAIREYNKITENSTPPSYSVSNVNDTDGKLVELNNGVIPYEHFNIIANIMRTKLGEKTGLEYTTHIVVENAEAISAANDWAKKMITDFYLKNYLPEKLDKDTELTDEIEALISEMGNDIMDILSLMPRVAMAESMERQMNLWEEEHKFDFTIEQTRLTYNLTNHAKFAPYIDEETLTVKCPYIPPTDIIFDPNIKDQFGKDGEFFMRIEYLSINAICKEFGLSYDELLKESEVRDKNGNTSISITWLYGMSQVDANGRILSTPINGAPGIMNPYTGDAIWQYVDGVYYLQVIRCVWKDITKTDEGEDYHGELFEYENDVVEKFNKFKEELFFANIIGCGIVGTSGKYKHQLRSIESPLKVEIPFEMLAYDYQLGTDTPNDIMRVQGLIKHRNFILYKISQLIGGSHGDIMNIDASLIPKSSDNIYNDLIEYLKMLRSNNLSVQNLGDLDMINQNPVGKAINALTITHGTIPLFMPLVEYANFLELEIRKILSFSSGRSGQADKYESAANALMNKTQSDYGTASQDHAFDRFIENTKCKIVNLLKIANYLKSVRYKNNEKALNLLKLKYGSSFILIDKDNALIQDYGLICKQRLNDEQLKKETLIVWQQMLMQGVPKKDILDYIDAADSPNYRSTIGKLRQQVLAEEQLKAQQEQAMAEQQQQASAQQQQAMMEQQGANQQEMQGAKMVENQQQADLKLRNDTELQRQKQSTVQ